MIPELIAALANPYTWMLLGPCIVLILASLTWAGMLLKENKTQKAAMATSEERLKEMAGQISAAFIDGSAELTSYLKSLNAYSAEAHVDPKSVADLERRIDAMKERMETLKRAKAEEQQQAKELATTSGKKAGKK